MGYCFDIFQLLSRSFFPFSSSDFSRNSNQLFKQQVAIFIERDQLCPLCDQCIMRENKHLEFEFEKGCTFHVIFICDVTLDKNSIAFSILGLEFFRRFLPTFRWNIQDTNLERIIVYYTNMMTSSNGNIFCVNGPLCGEFTGHRWIPLTKASDAELWCFLWSAPE